MTLGYSRLIRGVNLGNWLVLEKWMSPSLFAPSRQDDEIWLQRTTPSASLCTQLQHHRNTYITEQDFATIAHHGYNLVRLPVPFFVFGQGPSLASYQHIDWQQVACIEYVDQAFTWAQRYGLSILLDLHTVPDSQNGFDNGGITGVCKWAQQPQLVSFALHVLEQLAQRYKHHPALWGIEVLNEPVSKLVYATSASSRQAKDNNEAQGSDYIHARFLHTFYRVAYQRLRKILKPQTFIVFHDGFRLMSIGLWLSIQPMHHVMLDTHLYLCSLDAGLAAFRKATHGRCQMYPSERMYALMMALWSAQLRILRSRVLPHRVHVLVGEWNIVHHNDAHDDADMQTHHSYQRIAQLQERVWRHTAGSVYWSYQLERDMSRQPRHFATGESLMAWDLRHVWATLHIL